MRTYTLVFDGTGVDAKTLPRGTFFLILSTAAALSLKVYKGGSEIAAMSGSALQQGIGWESLDEVGGLLPFDEIRINSAVAQSAQVAVGFGRLVNYALTGTVTANLTKSSVHAEDADTVIAALGTLLLNADSTRRAAVICSDPVNAGTALRVSSAGGAKGEFLQAGMSVIVNSTGVIRVYNPDAVNTANVGVRYEKD